MYKKVKWTRSSNFWMSFEIMLDYYSFNYLITMVWVFYLLFLLRHIWLLKISSYGHFYKVYKSPQMKATIFVLRHQYEKGPGLDLCYLYAIEYLYFTCSYIA